MEHEITDSVIKSIRSICAYLYEDEKRHFEEEGDEINKQRHIFQDVQKVREWAENQIISEDVPF